MKKLFLIISLILVVFVVQAQKYPFGNATETTLTSAATVALAEITNDLTIYTCATDTNITVNAATVDDNLRAGARLIFVLTESTANADTITWGTTLTGTVDALPSGKTKIVEFIFNGTTFYKVATNQVD